MLGGCRILFHVACPFFEDEIQFQTKGYAALFIRPSTTFGYTSPDLPIVNANVNDITEKLAWLAGDLNLRAHLGEKGIQYLRKSHDVRVIAKQCVQLYERTIPSNL